MTSQYVCSPFVIIVSFLHILFVLVRSLLCEIMPNDHSPTVLLPHHSESAATLLNIDSARNYFEKFVTTHMQA